MPKIFNTSWLAVILATAAFFMIGFVWYGMFFDEIWEQASGITEDMATANMEAKGGMIFVAAIAATLGQAIGLLMIINYAGAKRMVTCLKIAFWTGLCFGTTIIAYNSIWGMYPLDGYLVDAGHFLFGYQAMGAIYALFRGRDAEII